GVPGKDDFDSVFDGHRPYCNYLLPIHIEIEIGIEPTEPELQYGRRETDKCESNP
ncbi:hypothetical protein AVEN_266759-1, partial [Araneus ventricosus]